ncbi:hypothetical protein [Tenacibaculum larymnensis]|uniref:Uncharacterized protein n=1 Tax=Tenacibaculum larymnensis TaxID=2878201 RepID=A0A9X4ERZ3_9FLAO|nr:hypothetical protein [Tenacibaculum larymnensis]MDE1207650.1 hypothetical protein [Tenacibaculum larymnensis]
MFEKFKWRVTNEIISLENLDPIYQKILLNYDNEIKLEYCVSKLFRVKHDLKRTASSKEKKYLKELEKSLDKEIQILKTEIVN